MCEDGDVHGHRFVLSTESNVFSKMLKSSNTNQPNLNTKKLNHKVQLKGICKIELNWIEETSCNEDYWQWSILDVLIRNSLTKSNDDIGFIATFARRNF